MSNKSNDFNFDDDDNLFRNDDFSTFDDFSDDADLDNDYIGLDDGDPLLDDGDGSPEPRRTSRVFVILAVFLVVILLLGFGVLLFALLGGNQGSPELNATRTAIAEQNATTLAQLSTIEAQNTESFIATLTATSFTATPSPTFTPSATSTPSDDFTATAVANLTATVQAFNLQGTSDAIGAIGTATALAGGQGGGDNATPTPEGGLIVETADSSQITPISADAVAQTATALSALFDPANLTLQAGNNGGNPTQTGGVVVVSTPTGGNNTGGSTTLPDTGLFDELNTGSMSALAVVAFGLVGIIVFARRGRKSVSK